MSIYAIIYLGFTLIGLLIIAKNHGKSSVKIHNFWHSVYGAIPVWILLYMGGFFK